MTETVLLSDPRIAAVPIRECREPLVDLRTVGPLLIDPHRSGPDGAYAHVRTGVVDRLVTAQSLLRRNLRLLIIEGYRPAAVQEQYLQECYNRLRAAHPEWSGGEIQDAAAELVLPPHVAGHVAGAAVDLTLAEGDGAELAMDGQAEGRTHRALLSSALRAAGFVSDPARWWHWSYGDRYWTFVTGHTSARYGPVGE